MHETHSGTIRLLEIDKGWVTIIIATSLTAHQTSTSTTTRVPLNIFAYLSISPHNIPLSIIQDMSQVASPGRTRSVSQPIREGVAADFTSYASSVDASTLKPSRSGFSRSQSSSSVLRSARSMEGLHSAGQKGRARSSSLVTVTEVGGDEPENVVDRVGMGTNENAAWVNAPGELVLDLF